jgi:uncharacterized protein
MGILEKIKDIELELSRMQRNKGTEHHWGLLKARLAKLRTQLLEGPKTAGATEHEGFDVTKTGDARVALIGFPSVGKSTLLSVLTGTESTAAAYEVSSDHLCFGFLRCVLPSKPPRLCSSFRALFWRLCSSPP